MKHYNIINLNVENKTFCAPRGHHHNIFIKVNVILVVMHKHQNRPKLIKYLLSCPPKPKRTVSVWWEWTIKRTSFFSSHIVIIGIVILYSLLCVYRRKFPILSHWCVFGRQCVWLLLNVPWIIIFLYYVIICNNVCCWMRIYVLTSIFYSNVSLF